MTFDDDPAPGCGLMIAIALGFAIMVACAALGYFLAPYFRHLT